MRIFILFVCIFSNITIGVGQKDSLNHKSYEVRFDSLTFSMDYLETWQNIFSYKEPFSYFYPIDTTQLDKYPLGHILTCYNNETLDTLYQIMVPETDLLHFQDDFVVGLTGFQYLTFYILDMVSGKLLSLYSINMLEFKLDRLEYKYFKKTYPEETKQLLKINHIKKIGRYHYVNVVTPTIEYEQILDKYLEYSRFDNTLIQNHLGEFVTSTAGIHWYDYENPDINIKSRRGVPIRLEINQYRKDSVRKIENQVRLSIKLDRKTRKN